MLLLWTLLLLLTPPSVAGQEDFFVQLEGSVTLPIKDQMKEGNVYVRWYFCSGQEQHLLIWKHPKQDAPKNEASEGFKTRVSLTKDSFLVISPVQETDFSNTGFFKCELQDISRRSNLEYRLHRVKMPTALTLVAGDDLSLSCETDSGVTVPSVRCIPPSGLPYMYLTKNKLLVQNISFQHSGVWKCEATKLNTVTTVTVIDLSPVESSIVYTTMSQSPPSLQCSLFSEISWEALQEKGLRTGSWSFAPLNQNHQPKQLLQLQLQPSPAWRQTNISRTSNETFLEERELKSHVLSVQLPKKSPRVQGTFTCSLEFNSGRTLSRTLKLEVLEAHASRGAARGEVTALVGDQVNLTCSLGHSLTAGLTVEWTLPELSRFPIGKPPHPEHLYIPAVSLQDSGQWTCSLKKDTSTLISTSVTLKIERLVDIWVIVVIASALVFILLLVIAVIFVRRHKQAVMFRRRKTKYCCCKNPKTKGFYKT